MPRDSNGTYTLPAGNPVVSGTTISSTWANSTLSDIATAITDSLSRDGEGSMAAPLQLADGSIGAPGLTWANETTTGWYRSGSGVIRFALGGADKFQLNTDGISASFGTVLLPSYSFIGDPDTGMYRVGVNSVGFACNGSAVLVLTTNGLDIQGLSSRITNLIGTVGAPSYTFSSDLNTGMYLSSADVLGLAAGGVAGATISATVLTVPGIFRAGSGTNADPSYGFGSDQDVGMYLSGANLIGFTTAGTLRSQIGGVNGQSFIASSLGDPTTPDFTFAGDGDCGMYRIGANSMGLSTNGTLALTVASNQTIRFISGSAAAPSIAFASDVDNGLYLSGTNEVSMSTAGTLAATFTADGCIQAGIAGTGTSPVAFTFASDPDTGLVRGATNRLDIVAGGASNIRVGTTSVVFSSAVTTIQFSGITTTASAGNAFLDSGDANRIFRSTSSLRYKDEVLELFWPEAANVINYLRPITYISKIETDRKQRWYGLIAEEVALIEPRLVHYDADNKPDGVQYDRIVAPLIAYVQHLEKRISKLEEK